MIIKKSTLYLKEKYRQENEKTAGKI